MKILDAPSQFKNVRNTTSQCHRHQLRQKIHHVRQKYIMYAKQNTTYTKHQVHQTKTKFFNQNTKYAKQNTKYAKQNTKYWFTLFCREIIFVANLRTFWRTFYRPKKYGGVPKMTIIRYGCVLLGNVSKRTTRWPFLRRGHGKLRGFMVMWLHRPNKGPCNHVIL